MSNKRYSYDYEKLATSFEGFRKKLGILENLKSGDKIGFDEQNEIYISVNNYIQGLSRWYYSQKREDVFRKLDEQLQEYLLYLRYVDDVYTNTTNIQNASIVKELILRISKLSTSIINALDVLRATYKDDVEVVKKIMSLKNSTDYRTRQLTDYCW